MISTTTFLVIDIRNWHFY